MKVIILLIFFVFSGLVSAGQYLSDFCDKEYKSCTDSQFLSALRASKGDILWIDFDEVYIDFNSPLWPSSSYDKSKAGWYNVTIDGRSSVRRLGSGTGNAIIKTNSLSFYNMNSFTFKNITLTARNPYEFPSANENEALLQFGGNNLNYPVKNIHLEDVNIENAPGNLIYIYNTKNFKLINSVLRDAGKAQKVDESKERPIGTGIESHLIDGLLIEGSEFKNMPRLGIAIWYAGVELKERNTNSNITIRDNFINGIGWHGIYVGQTLQNRNVRIINNFISDFRYHGIRVNGTDIIVEGNSLVKNSSEIVTCGNGRATKNDAVGVVSFMLKDSRISDNCIDSISTGVHLKSWGMMSGNEIKSNRINNVNVGIELLVSTSPQNAESKNWNKDRFFTFDELGFKDGQAWHENPENELYIPIKESLSELSIRDNRLSNNTVSDNIITKYSTQAICLVCRNTYPSGHTDMGENNTLYRNTVNNFGEESTRAPIEVEFQKYLTVSYNWVKGGGEYFIYMNNIIYSFIRSSTFINESENSSVFIRMIDSSNNDFMNLDLCGFLSHGISPKDGNSIGNVNLFSLSNCPS